MADFPMCEACDAEYRNPADRRFHAQPDACFECGPHISWWEKGFTETPRRTKPLTAPILTKTERCGAAPFRPAMRFSRAQPDFLHEGAIVAVKGLGGFHLACDARNPEALAELRRRKRREGKAFAVMYRTLDDVRETCQVNDAERRLLAGTQRPIVLLKKHDDAKFAAGLADHLPELGLCCRIRRCSTCCLPRSADHSS